MSTSPAERKSRARPKARAADTPIPDEEKTNVPLLTCRPYEFNLLRESLPDRSAYATTYAEYLTKQHEFVHEMLAKPDVMLLRGTWDIPMFLAWCAEKGLKPRKPARLAFFEEFARRCLKGEQKDPEPSYTRYVNDLGPTVLRYCSSDACAKLEATHSTFAACSRCKCVVYCSPACQKADWSSHKAHCKAPIK